jgi:hypothetical protein
MQDEIETLSAPSSNNWQLKLSIGILISQLILYCITVKECDIKVKDNGSIGYTTMEHTKSAHEGFKSLY